MPVSATFRTSSGTAAGAADSTAALIVILPPAAVNFVAFCTRFEITCEKRVGSTSMMR